MSPSPLAATNVLPSKTLNVRSSTASPLAGARDAGRTAEREGAAARGTPARRPGVDRLVGGRHPLDAVAVDDAVAARCGIDRAEPADRVCHLALVVDQEAVAAVDDDVRSRAFGE